MVAAVTSFIESADLGPAAGDCLGTFDGKGRDVGMEMALLREQVWLNSGM